VWLREDLELVHQASSAGQPEAEPAVRRESLLERCLDILDTGAFVECEHEQPTAAVLLETAHADLTRADVHDDVAGDLGDRGGDQGGVGPREAQPRRERARLGAGGHEIGVVADRHPDLIRHPRTLLR
jgi:hypothetical protein